MHFSIQSIFYKLMKILFAFLFFLSLPSHAVQVTFRVDMGNIPIHTEGIHISGNVNNWKLKESILTHSSGSIYEIKLEINPNKIYEYKYFNGAKWADGEFPFGPCANGGFRKIIVEDDSILPIVPFNSCNEKLDSNNKIKIACIGNSITYGYGVSNRFDNCYPSQLQNLLGDKYLVYNFGIAGKTLSRNVNDSYWSTPPFTHSHLPFMPDKVIIMLGTNDSKPQIWDVTQDHFEEDLIALIDSYSTLPSQPKVIIATPPMVYPNNFDIRNPIVENEIIPIYERVCKQNNIQIIPIHELTKNRIEVFPDGVHPNNEGAKLIANKIYEALK